MSITYSIDEALNGKEVKLNCITCNANTTHFVKSNFCEDGEEYHHQSVYFQWSNSYQIVQCAGCKSISFCIVSTDSESYDYDHTGMYNIKTYKQFPQVVQGFSGLKDGLDLLPEKIKKIYDETSLALAVDAHVLAGIGMRALLEALCKERSITGYNLLKKIEGLVLAGLLSQSSSQILHKIRALGNKAAHEIEPHSKKQLAIAMQVIDHLLLEIYIIPIKVKQEFENDDIEEL